MICNNCGKQIADESAFCPYCGLKIPVTGMVQTVQETQISQSPQIIQTTQVSQSAQLNREEQAVGKVETVKNHNKYVKWMILASSFALICAVALIVVLVISLDDKTTNKEISEEFTDFSEDDSSYISDVSFDFSKAGVGDIIRFGSYEQDRIKNGEDPIEWIVLSKNADQMLVMSKYALDCKPYNLEYVDVTWENCSLRKWLNNEFYKIAFDRSERAMIKETTIRNDDNAESGTIGGNDTIDRVFILSVDDMGKEEYGFDPNIEAYDESRRCSPTEYAVSQGAYQYFGTGSNYLTSEGKGAGFWWLRSPGKSGDYAASVNSRGYVRDYGDSVRVGANAVRPVMWIKIKSE